MTPSALAPVLLDVSPLVEIERAVQAKARDLDPRTDAGRVGIATLISDEVRNWRSDFERGLRAVDLPDIDSVAERALRNLAGYGPLEALLADDDVYEIIVNSPSAIFVKRHSGPSGYHDDAFHDDEHVTRTLTKILDDAAQGSVHGATNRKLDPAEGLQDAQLPDGSRLHIVHGDLGRGGHMLVNIRRFTGVRFHDLRQLVSTGTLDEASAAFLRACVAARQTIVFSGAPGSGKTTLMSCCAAELDPELRVVVAEEVFEADIPLANVASMQTRSARPDRREIDLRRLVSGFLRMAPDVAIVGEVRDREVLPLLLTLSSGVKGFTTLHAGSARQAMSRLRFIAQLADTSNELPMSALNALISEAVDVVVHCGRTPDGPRVLEISAVEDLQANLNGTSFTMTEVLRRPRPDAELCWTGAVPARLAHAFDVSGQDIHTTLDRAHPWPEGGTR